MTLNPPNQARQFVALGRESTLNRHEEFVALGRKWP